MLQNLEKEQMFTLKKRGAGTRFCFGMIDCILACNASEMVGQNTRGVKKVLGAFLLGRIYVAVKAASSLTISIVEK